MGIMDMTTFMPAIKVRHKYTGETEIWLVITTTDDEWVMDKVNRMLFAGEWEVLDKDVHYYEEGFKVVMSDGFS